MRTDYFKLHKRIRKETSDRIFNDVYQQEKAKNYVRRDKYDADIQKKRFGFAAAVDFAG